MPMRPPVFVVLLLTFGAFAAPTGVASAQSSEAASQAERLDELRAIRDRIASLEAELQQVRQRRSGLADSVRQLELELELQASRLAEAESAVGILGQQIHTTRRTVESIHRRSTEVAERLRASLAALYRMGRGGLLRLALSIDRDEGLHQGVRWLRYLAWRHSSSLDQYLEAQARLDLEREELERHRQRLAEWLQTQRQRRQRLAALRRERRGMLEAAEERQARLTGETESLRRKASRLENLVDFLYGRSQTPLVGRSIQEFRGVLDWPVRGDVVVPFGPRRDPEYGTLVPHNGVRIATSKGSPVRSIYPGRVVFAAPVAGYGPTVIVSHPGRGFTLYAGLERVVVGESAVLSLGQDVGIADDAIYFEIRLQNRPHDPLDWLR